MKHLKKILSVALIAIMVLGSMCVTVDAATSTGYVYVNAVQDYAQVQKALTALNKQRKKAGLKAVTLDKELCDLAVQRAAEANVYMDNKHTRPNGTDRGTISKRLEKENWAMGSHIDGTSVVDSVWMDSPGHKKNMLYNKAVSAGIAFVKVEGFSPHCILILSSTKVKTKMTTKTGTKTYNSKVEVKSSYLKASNFTIRDKHVGEFSFAEDFDYFQPGQKFGAIVEFNANAGKKYDVRLDPKSFTWTSSDKLVANVKTDGTIVGIFPGETTISAKMKTSPGITITKKITIDGNPYGFGYNEYDYDSDPYYSNYFEEDDDWMFGYSKAEQEQSEPAEPALTLEEASTKAAKTIDLKVSDPDNNRYSSIEDLSNIRWGYHELFDVDVTDELSFKTYYSGKEDPELLSHITFSLNKYFTQKGCVIDNDNHKISFTGAGEFDILVTTDGTVNVPVSEFLIYVTKALESASIQMDPYGRAKVYDPVTIRCNASGGRGEELFSFTITDQSGNVVESYSVEDTIQAKWTWVPEELGSYTIKAVVEDLSGRDNISVENSVTYNVVQADHPLVMPEEEYIVPEKPGNAALPAGWSFAPEDMDISMSDGDYMDLTAYYTANDSYKFTNTEAAVRVTCKECDHNAPVKVEGKTEATCIATGFSGRKTCSLCGALLDGGEVVDKNPDNHAELITTVKPAEIYVPGHTEHQYCAACDTVAKQGEETAAINSYTMNTTSLTYNGKGRTVNGVFKAGDYTLVKDKDYTVKYTSNTKVGMATVKYTFKGDYSGTFEDYFDIVKAANPMTAKAKSPAVKYSALKKKNQTIAAKNAITVSKPQGTVTYKKTSGNSKITVASNGKITVRKGLKKGNYKVNIKVTAAGNSNYKSGSKTVTVTIKVK